MSKKQAKKARKQATAMTADTRISLAKGVDPKAKRGLMGQMAVKIGKGSVTREALSKAFAKGKVTHVQVMKNVQWGVRHGVFVAK